MGKKEHMAGRGGEGIYLELEMASSKALISNSRDLTKELISRWPPLRVASVD